jgi:tRNA(Ile2) C34 agmatinyltransferase TiaS
LVSGIFTNIAFSDEYIITPQDISSSEEYTWVSVGFAEPVLLEEGEYVVVVSAGQDGISVAAQEPQTQSENHSWILKNGQWESTS